MHRHAARIGILAVLALLAMVGAGADGASLGAPTHRAPLAALARRAPLGGAHGSRAGAGGPRAPLARASQSAGYADVSGTATGATIAPGFVGTSLEFKAVHDYTGRNPYAINPVLVALLRGLAPGQAPVVRIGGNSTDSTWWPMRGVVPPRGVSYDLTGDWMRTTHALAAALGAHMILGVNLGSGRPAVAATESRAFLRGIGRRYVQGLEIGNEADVFGVIPNYRTRAGAPEYPRGRGYDLSAFTGEFSRWRAALPRVPLVGPAFAELTWLNGLGGFLAAEPGVGVVTAHRYPLRGCVTDHASPVFATIPNLLGDFSSAGLTQGIAPYVPIAHARGLPFRIDEMNSVACSGTRQVSNTFASALWALDTMFNMASVGVDGVNLHTFPGASYELFTFRHSDGRWSAFVHPEYYGLLMFARAAPPGSKLLAVSAPAGAVKVWATRGPDGKVRTVLINKDPSSAYTLRIQTAAAGPASVQTLQAPSASSTIGVSLGGQSFGTRTYTGTLPGPSASAMVYPSSGGYSIELPPASAVLLTQ